MKPKALLTTIPSDSHNWNLIYMQLLLEENGFEVANLGACTTYEEVERACLKSAPDLIVVSSVNGHAYLEGEELVKRIRKVPAMEDVEIYIGGKLSTNTDMSYFYAAELEMAGYQKAYYGSSGIPDFIRRLQNFKVKIG